MLFLVDLKIPRCPAYIDGRISLRKLIAPTGMDIRNMTVLRRCTTIHGNVTVIESEPSFACHLDLFYFPDMWGLYDRGGRLVTGSGLFRRSNNLDLVNADYTRSFDAADVVSEAPDELYYLLGHIPLHYGHFLLSAFSRLWAYAARAGVGVKLVVHGHVSDLDLERNPYIMELLGAFGINRDQLVSFDQPTRLRRVMVASASFEETNIAHIAFVQMSRRVADILTRRIEPEPSTAPIYLAKYRLPNGVVKLMNEEDFVGILESRGVRIEFPETLTLGQQIRLWADHHRISGLIGSALHTSAFVSPRRLMVLNYDAAILSNQVMIDRAAMHDSLYVYSTLGAEHGGHSEDFSSVRILVEPSTVANEFLRILDPFMGIKATKVRHPECDDCDEECYHVRTNLALRRPARQSSCSEFSMKLTPEDDAAGAVSGFLTGYYQFHTNNEKHAWWDVDLGSVRCVSEIRIYNRMDPGRERIASFALSVSSDDMDWFEIHRRESWIPFGGIDGRPFVWRSPTFVQARFVRITQLADDYMHLDQVVVHGPSHRSRPQSWRSLRKRRYMLLTHFNKIMFVTKDGDLISRYPSDAPGDETPLCLETNLSPDGEGFLERDDRSLLARAETIVDGPIAGLAFHIIDPWTAALCRDGLYYVVTPDDARARPARERIGAWEMFALVEVALP